VLAEALVEDPEVGVQLFFEDNPDIRGAYKYYSRITFFGVQKVFLMLRITAVMDLFTFRTYSATALIYAVLSFLSAWYLFLVLIRIYPARRRLLAICLLFIPTVVFWGSGIFRDTLVLCGINILMGVAFNYVHYKKIRWWELILAFVSLYVIYNIKEYVIACLIPFFGILLLNHLVSGFQSLMLRIMVVVPLVLIIGGLSFYILNTAIGEDSKYSLDNIAETARITAYDIGFYTGASAGSGYDLGELDGTFSGMVRLAPAGINVALFRPYLWEIRNPLMLLSALESLIFFGLTIYLLIISRFRIFKNIFNSSIASSMLVYALIFAFAVGVSTYNFGTLSRYRIPVLPFYLSALVIGSIGIRPKTELNE
jgi:hypothetical protein